MGDINNSLCRMEVARARTVSTGMVSILQFLISVGHKRVAFGH